MNAAEFKRKALGQGVKVHTARKRKGKIVVQYSFFLDESFWPVRRETNTLTSVFTRLYDCDYKDINLIKN